MCRTVENWYVRDMKIYGPRDPFGDKYIVVRIAGGDTLWGGRPGKFESRHTTLLSIRDGKITYIVDNGTIELYNEEGQHMSTIERMNKTNYIIRDKDVFYVDKGNNMVKVSVTANGNMPQYLGQVYRPLFEVSKDGKMFIAFILIEISVLV